MPDRHVSRTALALAVISLLAVSLATASPDRARSRAADFVQSVANAECSMAASMIDWPLELEDELIELEDWRLPCERLRGRLITARIDAVFQADELTSVMPPRQLEREDVYFTDLILAQRPEHEQASGINLAFDCSSAGCRLVAIHERLLHHRHYAGKETPPDYEGALRAAQLAGVLQSLTPLKIMLTEHYQVTGQWPASVEELGLEPDRLHGRGIEKIQILPGGAIRARLSAEFGPGMTLDLLPAEQMDGLSMRWNCRTNLPGEMTASLAGMNCRSR